MAASKTRRRDPDAAASGRRIAAEGTDHWAFLEEIEAPMWVDLKVDGQRVNEEHSDDAWFHTTHLVHQLSTRRLRSSTPRCTTHEKPDKQEILCRSPSLPDSVSRSRGKHYSAKKWSGGKLHISSSEHYPIRNLAGKSGSTIASSTPLTKSRSKSVNVKGGSCLKRSPPAAAAGETISRDPSSNPKPRISIPSTSSTLSSTTRLSVAACRVARVLLGVEAKGKRQSASRTSVVSSASHECRVSTKQEKITRNGIDKSRFVGRNLNSVSDRCGDDKCSRNTCQEQNLKALHPDRLRKPLSLLNVVGPVRRVVSSCEKNADRGTIQTLKSSNSCREERPGRNGVTNVKGKTHGAKRATVAAAPRRIASAKHLR